MTTRDRGRDRSVLALAAALCGALAAAGIAAVAVTSQLTPRHGEEALSETRAALNAATQELERSREMLQETRSQLASARAPQAAPVSAPGCRHRPQPPQAKTIPTAHILRTVGPNTTTVMSTFRVTTSHVAAPPPVANPALKCDEGHRCTVRRDFLEAALFGVDGPRSRAQVVPLVHGDALVGMKVFAVRHGDPAEVLGFRDGDTILAINGEPWRGRSVLDMLATVQKLRAENPDDVTITIDRNGDRIDKRFDLL